MNKYNSQAIAVDFDGVIAEFSDGIEDKQNRAESLL